MNIWSTLWLKTLLWTNVHSIHSTPGYNNVRALGLVSTQTFIYPQMSTKPQGQYKQRVDVCFKLFQKSWNGVWACYLVMLKCTAASQIPAFQTMFLFSAYKPSIYSDMVSQHVAVAELTEAGTGTDRWCCPGLWGDWRKQTKTSEWATSSAAGTGEENSLTATGGKNKNTHTLHTHTQYNVKGVCNTDVFVK